MTLSSRARIATPAASRYVKQLCNHATHMGARSEWAPPEGVIEFPQGGICRFRAGPDELAVTAEAETSDQLARIQAIVAANLQRFGQRQGMTVHWSS